MFNPASQILLDIRRARFFIPGLSKFTYRIHSSDPQLRVLLGQSKDGWVLYKEIGHFEAGLCNYKVLLHMQRHNLFSKSPLRLFNLCQAVFHVNNSKKDFIGGTFHKA